MRMRSFVIACCLLLPAVAQDKTPDKQEAKQEKAKRPAPPPSNLKILKVTTDPEVKQIMRTFTVGLGVQCTFCHIQNNYPSDENPKKEIARNMIKMAQEINTKFPDGKMHVSCFTCHRGEAEPKTAPEPKPSQ